MLTILVFGIMLLVAPTFSTDATSETVKDQIVVQTPLQNYEKPTLRDYEECQNNRESCLDVCADSLTCQSECPLCPELHEKPLVVQGVNDTDFAVQPVAQVPLNTTNIIRLTNEINNIIKHDIQNRNEVNVQVQQNVSHIGGRFGLGYNEQGPCCYVVRRSKECEHKDNCKERSRQRVCGERCQARVMLARRVVQCDVEQPTECHETVEYVPRRRKSHSRHAKRTTEGNRCRYTGNAWPYVSCQGENVRVKRASCQRCLELPYGYILQNGLPSQCAGCFQGQFMGPVMPMLYMPYAPIQNPNFGYDYEQTGDEEPQVDSEPNPDSGWILETQKCFDDNNQMVDCPKPDEGSGDGDVDPPAHLENGSQKKDDDDDYGVEVQRRRRRQSRREFMRSSYSKRNSNSF
ncbi:uncharacterized protein Dwil_GK13299 [Drosophila willistoni]|uniref:Uncharacterized protein n=1 Tax=Drosophila willistoni TaxID=7260 RepID=B4NKT7_DROWI|nr:uncharacterized protein LOC6650563 [Drosophila willistoni]XP_023036048.1 uncharacterized protein LOC6650563 [Drosophila willistoni]XP_023036049.1 uncharacterized protein LOC6650563 [Drosophila willistoni]EDW84148.2 uncharacterized protein Dwil_GK13299 [Drosophila willistoni]